MDLRRPRGRPRGEISETIIELVSERPMAVRELAARMAVPVRRVEVTCSPPCAKSVCKALDDRWRSMGRLGLPMQSRCCVSRAWPAYGDEPIPVRGWARLGQQPEARTRRGASAGHPARAPARAPATLFHARRAVFQPGQASRAQRVGGRLRALSGPRHRHSFRFDGSRFEARRVDRCTS